VHTQTRGDPKWWEQARATPHRVRIRCQSFDNDIPLPIHAWFSVHNEQNRDQCVTIIHQHTPFSDDYLVSTDLRRPRKRSPIGKPYATCGSGVAIMVADLLPFISFCRPANLILRF